MSKKKEQIKTIKKAFKQVLKAFEKSDDKETRLQAAELISAGVKNVLLLLKSRPGIVQGDNAASGETENDIPVITPSPALVEEIRALVTPS